MSDEITKTEIEAMIEVQGRSAQQMEKIASSLNIIVEEQKKITVCLNGCPESQKAIYSMKEDVKFLRIILTSLVAVIGLGILILEIFNKFH